MLCKANGCDREARYKAACLCQKHYFRQRRYGTTETTKVGKGKESYLSPNGYVLIPRPGHPLAMRNGLVFEHRAVLHAAIGDEPMSCAICGAEVDWSTVHVDHIDDCRTNNAIENLRPTCRGCNTKRGRAEEHTYAGREAISHAGRTMTATEWARQPGVHLSGPAIRQRLKQGQSVEQALFGEKQTHKKAKELK